MRGLAAVFAVGTAAAVGLSRSQYEREHFVVEETVICSPKIKKPRTLVFLSDLHDKEFGRNNERLLHAIAHVRPDGILIGGDTMIVKPGRADLRVTERLLDGLRDMRNSMAGRNSKEPLRIYYANGNHEQRMQQDCGNYGSMYEEFRELLKNRGICYLADSTADWDEDISISGLDIDKKYYRNLRPSRMREEYLANHLGKPDPTRFQILLAHSPLFFKTYAAWGADLSLAGHFHGGTIRIPLLGGVMTPQFQFFLPCCAGEFEQSEKHMLVSRGLGTHSVNIRFCNKPQVAVITLKPGGTD